MDKLLSNVKMDRGKFAVRSLDQEGNDSSFWQSQTPEQRLVAAELMRQMVYGYDPLTDRLQRVLRVAQLGER